MKPKKKVSTLIGITFVAGVAVTIAAAALIFAADGEANGKIRFEPVRSDSLSITEPDNLPGVNDISVRGNSLDGTAIVEVVTEPTICDGSRVRFSGVPSGEITLGDCEPGSPVPARRLTAVAVPAGTVESRLSYIDPAISQLGYELTQIRCDDGQSQVSSLGDLEGRKAVFGVETGESVTCRFVLSIPSRCLCPKEGRWKVKNNAGTMACTGSFNFTHALKAGTTTGTIEIRDNCDVLVAKGMSDDEATITYRRTSSCDYAGSVGQEQFGVPLTINFTLAVENEEQMSGDLKSTVSTQGATCNMFRTYEMEFAGGN